MRTAEGTADVNEAAIVAVPQTGRNAVAPATDAVLPGKPLVEAPEFADRVRDTDKEPYWIPGFPNDLPERDGRPI